MIKTFSLNPTGIQVFNSSHFGCVRTLIDNQGEPLFCLKDVCVALQLDGKQVIRRLEKGVVSKHPLQTTGGLQLVSFINEDGLYDVILDSRKPSARAFRKWVTSEVLPQIRQTGGYIPTKNPRTGKALTDTEIINVANKILKSTIARKNHPADDCFTTREIAKEFGLDAKDLTNFLVDAGVIHWKGLRYHITPKYEGLGYDACRYFSSYSLKGRAKEKPYLVWTPLGKLFIEKVIKGELVV